MKLSNIKIGRKLGLAFGGGVLLILGLASMALWALSDADAAAEKALHYAHKKEVTVKVSANMMEITAHITNLPNTKHFDQEIEQVLALRKEYVAILEYLKAEATTDEDRRLLTAVETANQPWREYNNGIMAAVKAGKKVNAAEISEESVKRFLVVKTDIAAYIKYRQDRLDMFQQERAATAARMKIWLISLALFSVPLAIVLGWLIARDIASPLQNVVAQLDEIAGGDLSHEVPAEYLGRGDEIGLLCQAMQTMSASLRMVIGEITGGIQVLTSSSTELSANSGQMSDGSREVSEKAHSVAAAAEQMTANVVSVASGMQQATASLSNVSAATEQMTETIGEIAGNSEKARRITEQATRQAASITEQMSQLGQAAQEIGKVTEAITEISAQTNLLALNATIEAARAGAAGKGFAVVANEIKTLAQQTAAATEDIKARIAGVQTSTAGGIAEIEKVSQVIHEVSDIVSTIAAAIEEQATATKDISRNIVEASMGVQEANVRVSESSQASRDISKEIAGVDQAARQMAEGSEQVQASSAELSGLAEQLQSTLGRFQVSGSERPSNTGKALPGRRVPRLETVPAH